MKLRLVAKHAEAGDAKTLVFQPEQPVSWQPGQFLQYHLPHADADERGQKRWFTISAAPFEGQIQITTRFFPKPSSFKRHLDQLKIGDDIEAGAPEGDFIITDPSQSFVFIAGGIGITPFRSILAQAAHDDQQLKVDLLYGNRDEASIVFMHELMRIAHHNRHLMTCYVIEPDRIDAEMLKSLTDYQSRTYYVSGPEPMVEAFETVLAGIDIPGDQQKYDYFPGYTTQ